MDDIKKASRRNVSMIMLIALLIMTTTALTAYAWFNYTKTGSDNLITTSTVIFNFEDTSNINISNAAPMSVSEIGNVYNSTFTITAHNDLTNGVEFSVYAVPGTAVSGKNRLSDSVIKALFTPPADGNGFTTTLNNYSTASNLTFTNGKALIAKGLVKDTVASTTKTYTFAMWIDEDLISVSSTTKRTNNVEGNPSVADATSGTITASRYITNDSSQSSTVTLYPARTDQQGKMVYTTYEFANSYYSVKITIEAVDKQ